ncbi:MAG TPA: recombinase family protein, partial [Candidatus Saccharimonadales bacterium]|nr:recombinase family protein [Candidatus Saccharimonadales bacterium]
GIIIKDPQRFHLRRLMWELMLTGNYSVPAVAKVANEQWGYRTRGNKRYPSGPLSRNSLYHMFNNPRYAGKIPTPGQPGVYEQASYEPMVTLEEYDAVQDLLGRRGAPKLAPKKVFRYRGILLCGECGCLITAEEKHKRLVSGRTSTHIYYHCTRKRPCTQRKNLTEQDIEQQFTDLLSRYTILPQFKDWALEMLGNQNERESTDCTAILKSQSRAIEAKHGEIKELIAMAAKKLISHDQFSAEKKRLEKEIKQLECEREDTKKRASTWYATAERLFDLAVHGRERFLTGSIEDKRTILLALGQNPVILDGKLIITPHPWVVPIEQGYKQLEAEYERVRTLPEHLQQGLMEAIRLMWLAIGDDLRALGCEQIIWVGLMGGL